MDIRQSIEQMKTDASSLIQLKKEVEGLGTVYFRSLPGYYVMKLNETGSFSKTEGEGEDKKVRFNPDEALEMICVCVCDSKGELVFATEENKELLKSFSMKILNELNEGVYEASGWTAKASEDIEKNSETVA